MYMTERPYSVTLALIQPNLCLQGPSDMSDTDAAVQLAPQVCVACKQHKRKCDKLLPGCSPCTRAGRECRYVAPSPAFREIKRLRRKLEQLEHSVVDTPTATKFDAAESNSSPSFVTETDLFPDHCPLLPFFTNDPFRYSQLRTPFVNVAILRDVSKIVGGMADHQRTAQTYFDTIHAWMPIISISSYFDRLRNVATEPRADFALLSLSLYLIIQIPNDSNMDSMRTSLYAKTKSLYSLVESAGIISVRTVQCGLLISLYELGHGLSNEAYVSIGGCARAAMILGIQGHSSTELPDHPDHRMDLEEERRVWWGIVILDRCINLCSGRDNFAARSPSLNHHLPVDDKLWDQNITTPNEPLLLSTPTDVRVGPFAREAQVSHVLGRVLRHVYDSTPDAAFNSEEAATLDRTLNSFIVLLPEEVDDCAMYCGAIGICNSARLLLHGYHLYGSTYPSSGMVRNGDGLGDGLLESSAKVVVDIAFNFHNLSKVLKMEALSPFVSHSLYQAAIVQTKLFEETGDVSYIGAYEALISMLHGFNKRWKTSEKYIRCLEQSCP